jgi:hypothetical protein
MVARILVKQAAKRVDRVSTRLSKAKEIDEVPRLDQLIEILKDYSTELSNMVVMFDALDEYDEFAEIVELIQKLNQFGIRVYATARDYLAPTLSQLQAKRLTIKANVQDVEKYLVHVLGKRTTRVPDPKFRAEIVATVARGIDGM